MGKQCQLCENEVTELQTIAEDYVLDLIEAEHPEWVESDGACIKCIEYYYALDKAVKID